jgi:hypothetical protein
MEAVFTHSIGDERIPDMVAFGDSIDVDPVRFAWFFGCCLNRERNRANHARFIRCDSEVVHVVAKLDRFLIHGRSLCFAKLRPR